MPVPKQAPKPEVERIYKLVERIDDGDIKIPKFQRGFIWKEEQILYILESIYHGYPIGSLLFWLTKTPMKEERNLGEFELPATPEQYPRNYVLDGQQRLTSIYGVLKWNKPEIADKLNVYFDLEQGKFLHYKDDDTSDTHVPMNILFDTSKGLDFRTKLYERPDGVELLKKYDVLYEIFREYLVPVVTIGEKTIEEVCPIFERINSSGTQLDVFDLMVAATWADDFDLNDEINKVKEALSKKNFENIRKSAYLKMIAGIKGYGVKRDSLLRLRKLPSKDLKDLTTKAKLGAERAIDFLSTDLSIPSDAFLPYEDQLVLFTYFFSKVPNPSSNQLKCLRKWFWQTGFSEYFRGAAEGTLQKNVHLMDSLINENYDELNIRVSIVENDLLKRQFTKNSAFCKTFILMLMKEDPLNITNGEKIDPNIALSQYNKKEFHHIFPQAFLKAEGFTNEKGNNICNICMLSSSQNKIISDASPSEYIPKFMAELGEHAGRVLESNLIHECCFPGLMSDDYDKFLKKRAELIIQKIKLLTSPEQIEIAPRITTQTPLNLEY